jgi:hypothetical protein
MQSVDPSFILMKFPLKKEVHNILAYSVRVLN